MALTLPCLFFLHPFTRTVALIASLVTFGYMALFPNYDEWIFKQINRFNPPNPYVAVILEFETLDPASLMDYTKTRISNVLFLARSREMSVPPPALRNRFGMVIVEKQTERSYYDLEYLYNCLTDGGKVVVVDGRHIVSVFEKIKEPKDPDAELDHWRWLGLE